MGARFMVPGVTFVGVAQKRGREHQQKEQSQFFSRS
jgi:hypothetical protein